VEVTARLAVSDLERGPVLENEPFNDGTIMNGMHGAPVHKHARALIRNNELHQRTKFSRRFEEVRLACRLGFLKPIHEGSAGFWASRSG
jgi:hypothetical protein